MQINSIQNGNFNKLLITNTGNKKKLSNNSTVVTEPQTCNISAQHFRTVLTCSNNITFKGYIPEQAAALKKVDNLIAKYDLLKRIEMHLGLIKNVTHNNACTKYVKDAMSDLEYRYNPKNKAQLGGWNGDEYTWESMKDKVLKAMEDIFFNPNDIPLGKVIGTCCKDFVDAFSQHPKLDINQRIPDNKNEEFANTYITQSILNHYKVNRFALWKHVQQEAYSEEYQFRCTIRSGYFKPGDYKPEDRYLVRPDGLVSKDYYQNKIHWESNQKSTQTTFELVETILNNNPYLDMNSYIVGRTLNDLIEFPTYSGIHESDRSLRRTSAFGYSCMEEVVDTTKAYIFNQNPADGIDYYVPYRDVKSFFADIIKKQHRYPSKWDKTETALSKYEKNLKKYEEKWEKEISNEETKLKSYLQNRFLSENDLNDYLNSLENTDEKELLSSLISLTEETKRNAGTDKPTDNQPKIKIPGATIETETSSPKVTTQTASEETDFSKTLVKEVIPDTYKMTNPKIGVTVVGKIDLSKIPDKRNSKKTDKANNKPKTHSGKPQSNQTQSKNHPQQTKKSNNK